MREVIDELDAFLLDVLRHLRCVEPAFLEELEGLSTTVCHLIGALSVREGERGRRLMLEHTGGG